MNNILLIVNIVNKFILHSIYIKLTKINYQILKFINVKLKCLSLMMLICYLMIKILI